ANSLKLWPEQHSHGKRLRVISSSLSGDWGKDRCGSRGPLDPHPAVQGLSQSSPSRISQTDQAQALYIWPSIANCDGRDNAPVIECPVHHSEARSPLNAAACADELETEPLPLRRYAGSFARTTLLSPECQLR